MSQENSFEAVHTCYQRINFKQSFSLPGFIIEFIPNNGSLVLSENSFHTILSYQCYERRYS